MAALLEAVDFFPSPHERLRVVGRVGAESAGGGGCGAGGGGGAAVTKRPPPPPTPPRRFASLRVGRGENDRAVGGEKSRQGFRRKTLGIWPTNIFREGCRRRLLPG